MGRREQRSAISFANCLASTPPLRQCSYFCQQNIMMKSMKTSSRIIQGGDVTESGARVNGGEFRFQT